MSDGWAYIARTTKPEPRWPVVGTAVCVVVDEPRCTPHKEVSMWMRQGMTIERVPVEWVRKHFGSAEPYRPT
jgi:hypothetical protein